GRHSPRDRRWPPRDRPGQRLSHVRPEGPALGACRRRQRRPLRRPRSVGRGRARRGEDRRRRNPRSPSGFLRNGAIRTHARRRHTRSPSAPMSWVILTGRQGDLDQAATPHKVITNRDYLAHPALFRAQRPKIINLSNSYAYQSRGYYASLLASSRGHKVIPTVETMIDLSERKLYEAALPELEQALNKGRAALGGNFPKKVSIFFGMGPGKAWERFARLLFDWFRAPALQVTIEDGAWASIKKIGFLPLARMNGEDRERFLHCLERYTAHQWRDSRTRTPARYTFATLVDPQEQ